MTISQLLKHAEQILVDAGVPGARLDTELLLAHATGRSRTWVMAHDDFRLTKKQTDVFNELISRRQERIPVVHLTGTREFYGLDFTITPDVLTPRVETEQMVEWAIKYAPPSSRLIDIGTGSGAIAIAIAKHRPDLKITATEVTAEALAVAKVNATRHEVPVELIMSDLWEHVSDRFQTVVTNLPYLPDNADLMAEVGREPAIALFGGPDGLDLYRRMLKPIRHYLAPGGYLFTESDPWQHESLTALAGEQGLDVLEKSYFVLGFTLRT